MFGMLQRYDIISDLMVLYMVDTEIYQLSYACSTLWKSMHSHVFAYLYTLDDDSEHPMNYDTSYSLKFFPSIASLRLSIQLTP